MARKGFTLIEIIVTISLISIMFLLATPLISGFGKVKNRVQIQKEIDRNFSNASDFINKKIRASKKSGSNANIFYAGVYKDFFSDSNDFFDSSNKVATTDFGNILFLEVAVNGGSEFVFFIFDPVDNKLKYREGFSSTNESLLDNVSMANFRFQEGIVVYFIDLDVGDYEGSVRDSLRSSSSTRVDLNN